MLFFISSYKPVTRKTKDSTISENTKSEKRFARTIDRETWFPTILPNREIQCILFQMPHIAVEFLQSLLLL